MSFNAISPTSLLGIENDTWHARGCTTVFLGIENDTWHKKGGGCHGSHGYRKRYPSHKRGVSLFSWVSKTIPATNRGVAKKENKVFRFPFFVFRLFSYLCNMKQFFALLKTWAQRLRKYISPVFLALLAVSFTLWYISKLKYTYTTDFNVEVTIGGEKVVVPCVVEGKGTTILGYGLYNSRTAEVSLSELKYRIQEQKVLPDGATDSVVVSRKMSISPASMRDALSVRFSDLKIVSVDHLPDLDL